MKRSLWLRTLLALVLAFLLVACGSGSDDTDTNDTGDSGSDSGSAPTAIPADELECTDDIGCVEVAPGDPINVAYMLTVSGDTAFLGEDSRGGIEIAFADRGNELLGHELQLTGEDSGCSADGGATAAQAVAADSSVVGIIGTNCSSAATAAAPIISEAGLVLISPSNTAPALTDDGPDGTWYPGYFRTAHNDKFQGRVAAEFAYNELGARTAATIHDGSPYADQLQLVFAEAFQALGGEVVFQGSVNVEDTDMVPVLTSVAAGAPDVLYFPIFEPAGNFIASQSRQVDGLEETILMGADGLLVDGFPENTGEAAIGMYLSGPYISGASYDDFLAKWESQIGGVPPSGFHAFAYDGTNILLDAIEQVAQVGDDGTVLIGRQALRDAITATSGFNGLSGNLTCTPTGDCATGEALAIFELTQAELDGNWPPTAVWAPGGTLDGGSDAGSDDGDPVSMECTDAIGCVEVAPGDPLNVAYMLTVSGDTAFLGEDSRGGIEIAFADRGGELLGHELFLVGEDSGCSADGGATAAQAVAADSSVVGIIGTNCSSAATAALPIISDAGLVMISPSNTAPALTDDGPEGTWFPGYFRTAHNDKFQGRVAAEFAYNELGARTAATIHDGSPYADQLQLVFAEVFQELGGEIVFQGSVNVEDTDMVPVLTSVAAGAPDVLYFPIFEPAGNFIASQSRQVDGLEETVLMGADGLLVDGFPENTGEAAVGMYLSGPYISGASYDEFLAKWADQIGGVPPSGFHAFAYDGTNILLNAIEQVAQVGEDGTLIIGRQALRDAITATSGFNGLSGNLTCTATGDCATGEALAIFELTQEELDGNWPPNAVWTP
ncbi:MAG TPA: branched-chain amino acid ABC transporter substrate-binding protein [Anaerolineae bacterium]|nr:branched-chain amino acid ABC transporter substrate-binding protein [Anaerolineae bacterium]